MCGGAVGVASIALQRHVGRMAENPIELKQVFSWLSIAPAFSNFLGPFSAGVMIDHGGFQAAFALLASFPIIAWLLLRNARELPNEDVRPRSSAAAWDLVRDKDIRRLLLMNWFMNASWDMHSFMIPVLGHERGLPATVIGGILGAFAVSAALIRVVLPLFAHRVKEWALITGATAVAGVLFLLYPFATSAWAMGLCSAALGTVLGTIQPMVMSMLHQITPRDRQRRLLGDGPHRGPGQPAGAGLAWDGSAARGALTARSARRSNLRQAHKPVRRHHPIISPRVARQHVSAHIRSPTARQRRPSGLHHDGCPRGRYADFLQVI